MKIANKLRWTLAGVMMLLTLIFLLFLFFATINFLNLWDRLQQAPDWLFYTYMGFIGLIVAASGYFIYRFLYAGNTANKVIEPVNEEQLREEIDKFEASGVDTLPLKAELEKLQQRKDSGQINIAFFGDVSTGKSSIIKALLPDAQIEPDLRGGSTRNIREYRWTARSGDRLLLTDLPGRNEAEGDLNEIVRDEAVRAQIVVYVIDSDFSRSQYDDVQQLRDFGKPLILAFNKSDQYNKEERTLLTQRIAGRFPATEQHNAPNVVFIQSGGSEEVIRVYPDGREETLIRPRKADVSALTRQIQQEIDGHIEWLEQLRDASVFTLVKQKLDQSRDDFRRQKAEKIVRTSTRNAIFGSLAALSPGTDIVIQGVIGTKMVKDLCDLYDCPVSQVDIDNFLDFSQGQVKKSIPLILAVAGNGLKAFPGVGTVAGGLVHAVAYGLIFDALGHAITHTLEQRGALKPAPAALTFREMLSGNMEERTKTFARLVVDQYRQKND
ncbi:MAG: GTPase [Thiolinea sp.]